MPAASLDITVTVPPLLVRRHGRWVHVHAHQGDRSFHALIQGDPRTLSRRKAVGGLDLTYWALRRDCTGMVSVRDQCGCRVATSWTAPDGIADRLAAHLLWVGNAPLDRAGP